MKKILTIPLPLLSILFIYSIDLSLIYLFWNNIISHYFKLPLLNFKYTLIFLLTIEVLKVIFNIGKVNSISIFYNNNTDDGNDNTNKTKISPIYENTKNLIESNDFMVITAKKLFLVLILFIINIF